MKVIVLLIVVLAVYLVWLRQSPVAATVEAASGKEAAVLSTGPKMPGPAGTTIVGRPIHRTHEVLATVKGRNGDGEF